MEELHRAELVSSRRPPAARALTHLRLRLLVLLDVDPEDVKIPIVSGPDEPADVKVGARQIWRCVE